MISGCLVQKEATREDVLSIGDSNKGKGKGRGGKQKIRPGFRPRSQKGKVISYNLLIKWGILGL